MLFTIQVPALCPDRFRSFQVRRVIYDVDYYKFIGDDCNQDFIAWFESSHLFRQAHLMFVRLVRYLVLVSVPAIVVCFGQWDALIIKELSAHAVILQRDWLCERIDFERVIPKDDSEIELRRFIGHALNHRVQRVRQGRRSTVEFRFPFHFAFTSNTVIFVTAQALSSPKSLQFRTHFQPRPTPTSSSFAAHRDVYF